MALQASVLKTRSLTAVLFVAIMGFGLFVNAWTYLFLFLLLLTVSWLEFTKLIEQITKRDSHTYLTIGWILNAYALCLLMAGQDYAIGSFVLRQNLILPFHLAGFIFLIWGTFVSHSISLRHWLLLAAGNLYLTLPWVLAIHLYGYGPTPFSADLFFDTSLWWVVIAVATMWTNDTLAYLLGSLIGRTPLSAISPKKTWEGTIAGMVGATLVVGWLVDRYLPNDVFAPGAGYVLIFLLASIGTIGDLFESKLKRLAGVKDSGKLMPGHGGVLDRFDSLLFALPLLYLFLRIYSLFH